MQELVIFLSSAAGLFTALAIKKFSKNQKSISFVGANHHIKNKIATLKIEKEILTRSISRLYHGSSDISKIQKDQLLLRYQHQLGIVLAKIEKLEESTKHPDLGPLGDGLITLMDQKLSDLDQRLVDLTSKINVTNDEVKETKQDETKIQEKFLEPKPEIKTEFIFDKHENQIDASSKQFEITTLTEIPNKVLTYPLKENQQSIKTEIVKEYLSSPKSENIEFNQSNSGKENLNKLQKMPETINSQTLPEIKKPKLPPNFPEEDKVEDDEDDLAKIKSQIMKSLSKLEQAEVE